MSVSRLWATTMATTGAVHTLQASTSALPDTRAMADMERKHSSVSSLLSLSLSLSHAHTHTHTHTHTGGTEGHALSSLIVVLDSTHM